jgi:hypothetical protein
MAEFKAPYFSKDDLRRQAEAFLGKYHPGRMIPVPIESILERMGIDIVPVPNLQLSCEVDAYTTSDLKEIIVEEFVYLHRPARYRFSLAHEAGHIWLHGDLFRSMKFNTAHEWKDFVSSIPERDYGFLEYHANEFAGQVLVPSNEMNEEVVVCKKTVLDTIPDAFRDPAPTATSSRPALRRSSTYRRRPPRDGWSGTAYPWTNS